jgi:hypothetical protein
MTGGDIFILILSLCKRLTHLNFCESYHYRRLPIFKIYDPTSPSCMSSTLTNLKIRVLSFNDCLYLLDGRLDCLSTLIIHVEKILGPLSNRFNTVNMIFSHCFEEKHF